MPDLAGSPQGWRIVLLAARTEADRRAQVASRRRRRSSEEQSARRFEQIRSVARQLTGLADNLREACDAQLVAEQARFDGHPDPAAWRVAADQWASNGQTHDQAWALVRLAEACLALRERALAAEAVTDAHTLAAALDAVPLITVTAAVARRGRIPMVPGEKKPRQPGTASWAGLTAREVEVLELVAAGHSNNQIAQALVISPKTVGTHVSHILTKLDVPSRAAAAAKAHRRQDVRS
jgi:DNA-binding CsgD family transcriptional regulator